MISEHVKDCSFLSKTALRNKYFSTYNCWRNMKQRAKKGEALIDPEFESFIGFLQHLGPRPTLDHSVDRLDNTNPTYGPGLVAWRTVAEQNVNKSTTVMLTDGEGKTLPLVEWAKLTSQKPDTMYKRKSKGWSDIEVINGKQGGAISLWGNTPWPKGYETKLEKAYQNAITEGGADHGEDRLAFYNRSVKRQIQALKDKYCDGGEPGVEMTEEEQAYYARLMFLLEDSQKKVDFRRQRNFFINREGGLGKHKEALFYDMFHKPPTG